MRKKKEVSYVPTGSQHPKERSNYNFHIGSQSFSNVPFTVVEKHPFQAILGYPALKKKSTFSLTQLDNRSMTQKGDMLLERHQEMLEKLKPVSPCRAVKHEFKMGELLNNEPFQEPVRSIDRGRKKFLMKWIPSEISNDLIEEGELGNWISPLVLVTHSDKNKNPIPGDCRVCLDATKINK